MVLVNAGLANPEPLLRIRNTTITAPSGFRIGGRGDKTGGRMIVEGTGTVVSTGADTTLSDGENGGTSGSLVLKDTGYFNGTGRTLQMGRISGCTALFSLMRIQTVSEYLEKG